MNTDNMSILGLTIDYGPYGWIDGFDPDWTPNTTDFGQRRYRFSAQPAVAQWNLMRFAEALYPLIGEVPPLQDAISAYADAFNAAQTEVIRDKLGLAAFEPDDHSLYTDLLELMTRVETDMTLLFRRLSTHESEGLEGLEDVFYGDVSPDVEADWRQWLKTYRVRLDRDGRPAEERRTQMDAVNPLYVLRNYLAQEAIELAEQGDASRVHELFEVMQQPYTEQPGKEHFAQKRPEWARDKPGCSTLSCSS
jgi:uncharacterized protein YdiU (UPF0061 family)